VELLSLLNHLNTFPPRFLPGPNTSLPLIYNRFPVMTVLNLQALNMCLARSQPRTGHHFTLRNLAFVNQRLYCR